jgi:hypothetical protein
VAPLTKPIKVTESGIAFYEATGIYSNKLVVFKSANSPIGRNHVKRDIYEGPGFFL